MVEVARLDHDQHRSKNLLLLKRGLRRNVRDYGRLNEVAFPRFRIASATRDQPAILLADLNIVQDIVHRTFINDRSHVRVRGWIPNRNALHTRLKHLKKFIVDPLVDNRARTSRTLLSLEAERRCRYTFNSGIDICVGVHDNRVFAAHFEDSSLDPELARLLLGGSLVNVQTDFAGPSERDVTNSRMCDQRVSEACAAAGTEIYDS